MKVGELIEMLQQYDPEAELYLAEQPSWPFEFSIAGVVQRENVLAEEDDDVAVCRDGMSPSDVLLIEGTQLRYGSKQTWAFARR